MPSGNYTCGYINYQDTKWVKTGDISWGKNHCASAAATNIVLYYAKIGYRDLKIDHKEYSTFLELYNIIQDGPVVKIAHKISDYSLQKGYNLKYRGIKDLEEFKDAIEENMPLTMLLSASLLKWHWVVAVGWREYENGHIYIQIVDNWNGKANRFYKVDTNLIYLFMTKYWIE